MTPQLTDLPAPLLIAVIVFVGVWCLASLFAKDDDKDEWTRGR
jgi:hypothetical protein